MLRSTALRPETNFVDVADAEGTWRPRGMLVRENRPGKIEPHPLAVRDFTTKTIWLIVRIRCHQHGDDTGWQEHLAGWKEIR